VTDTLFLFCFVALTGLTNSTAGMCKCHFIILSLASVKRPYILWLFSEGDWN